MRGCMYALMRAWERASVRGCVDVCMRGCVRASVGAWMYVCVNACERGCVDVCICECVRACVRMQGRSPVLDFSESKVRRGPSSLSLYRLSSKHLSVWMAYRLLS